MAHPVRPATTRPDAPSEPDFAWDAFPADACNMPVRVVLLLAIGLASIAATLLTLADLGAV